MINQYCVKHSGSERFTTVRGESVYFNVNKVGNLIFFDKNGLSPMEWQFKQGDWDSITAE